MLRRPSDRIRNEPPRGPLHGFQVRGSRQRAKHFYSTVRDANFMRIRHYLLVIVREKDLQRRSNKHPRRPSRHFTWIQCYSVTKVHSEQARSGEGLDLWGHTPTGRRLHFKLRRSKKKERKKEPQTALRLAPRSRTQLCSSTVPRCHLKVAILA